MPSDSPLPDPYLRRRWIIDDMSVDGSTLNAMIERGDFPKPEILNPGASREIPVWRSSVYRKWKDERPKRLPKPITEKAYTEEAVAKGRRTRAERQAAKAAAAPAPEPEPPPGPPGRVRRPMGRVLS